MRSSCRRLSLVTPRRHSCSSAKLPVRVTSWYRRAQGRRSSRWERDRRPRRAGCEKRQPGGHVKDEERDDECGGQARECGDMSFDAKAGHRDEKDDKRESGECGGEEATSAQDRNSVATAR